MDREFTCSIEEFCKEVDHQKKIQMLLKKYVFEKIIDLEEVKRIIKLEEEYKNTVRATI